MSELAKRARTAAPDGWTFGRHHGCCAEVAFTAPDLASGSRRQRPWKLASHAHCRVIGVCLPLAAMRRPTREVLSGKRIAGDYELHWQHGCRLPTSFAHDRCRAARAASPLHPAFAACRCGEDRSESCRLVARTGSSEDLARALWAARIHPRCTPSIERHVLGRVHMIRHQVGMATRAARARFETLIDESDKTRLRVPSEAAPARSPRQVPAVASRLCAGQLHVAAAGLNPVAARRGRLKGSR